MDPHTAEAERGESQFKLHLVSQTFKHSNYSHSQGAKARTDSPAHGAEDVEGQLQGAARSDHLEDHVGAPECAIS